MNQFESNSSSIGGTQLQIVKNRVSVKQKSCSSDKVHCLQISRVSGAVRVTVT